jgi:Protein of unknown function (DUF664)
MRLSSLCPEKWPSLYCEEDPDGDFRAVHPAHAPFDDLSRYEAELAMRRSRAALVADLDSALAGRRRGQQVNLRWVHLLMIEEYARHLGMPTYCAKPSTARPGTDNRAQSASRTTTTSASQNGMARSSPKTTPRIDRPSLEAQVPADGTEWLRCLDSTGALTAITSAGQQLSCLHSPVAGSLASAT